jgi:hypothetical protein
MKCSIWILKKIKNNSNQNLLVNLNKNNCTQQISVLIFSTLTHFSDPYFYRLNIFYQNFIKKQDIRIDKECKSSENKFYVVLYVDSPCRKCCRKCLKCKKDHKIDIFVKLQLMILLKVI